jgi:cation diffusion facilitator family transporter
MLWGMHRSRKPPDIQHPLGYAHELYFWTLVVGVLVFALGGGMSILTGVVHIANATPAEDSALGYGVLAIAAVFEGISWYFGFKAFAVERRGRGIVETIQRTKDPTTFSILLEDSAALLGLAIAFVGIYLSSKLGVPWIDGAASVLIGVLLCLVAFVMVYESRGLIVGEGVEQRTLDTLREIICADPQVERVDKLLTIYLGPDEVMLAMDVRFVSDLCISEVRTAIARVRDAIQARYPRVRHVFIDVTSTR